ncbi:hypothetical protein CAC42_990 [Sphaceloma murrayae]|uniref:Uncharacterized protein n=1 Tax=Sphaceloma murrayae TaxID=2082308 RepID=A0A2K1R2W9_9PEZI|nr:hypothetical protein CAC42_990 [Sphaceloma murrayae]
MGAPTISYSPYADAHKNTTGAGDGRPTAMKIIEDEGLINKWTDKVVLVTGANVGLGTETARALHATGARVFVTARTKEKVQPAIKDIMSTSPSKTPIEVVEMDLADLSSVRAGAASFLSRSSQLNVLITNAGIMGVAYGKTADGFERQIGTNHFGHFLLFQLLKETLLKSATPELPSRVVTVSSAGHSIAPPDLDNLNFEKPDTYQPFGAYGASKTANIWMANAIDRRYGSKGLHAFAIHPGVIFDTTLFRDVVPGSLQVDVEGWKKIAKSVAQGAATSIWAATAKGLEGKGGMYLADCQVGAPMTEGEEMGGPNYAPHAYNEEGEEGLWKASCKAVGVPED